MSPIGSANAAPSTGASATAGSLQPAAADGPPPDPSWFDHAVDGVLTGLDVASLGIICLPVGGEVLQAVPDLAAAGIRYARGDIHGGNYSMLCAAPFIGDVAGAAKLAGKLPQGAKFAAKAAGWGGKVAEKAFELGTRVSEKVMPWVGKAFGGQAAKVEEAAAEAAHEESKVVSIFKNASHGEGAAKEAAAAEKGTGPTLQADSLPPWVRAPIMQRVAKHAVGRLMGTAYVMGMPMTEQDRDKMLPSDQRWAKQNLDYSLRKMGLKPSNGARGYEGAVQAAQRYDQAQAGLHQALQGQVVYNQTAGVDDPSALPPEQARQQVEQRMQDPAYLAAPAAPPAVDGAEQARRAALERQRNESMSVVQGFMDHHLGTAAGQ